MVESTIESEGLLEEIRDELKSLGACDLCTLRYLGVKDPYPYRSTEQTNTLLKREDIKNGSESVNKSAEDENPDAAKIQKPNPCCVCLGLLQQCIEDSVLDQITGEIHKAEIQAASYAPMLMFPIAVLIRSYSMWFHLVDKYPSIYNSMMYLKPEGVNLKAVWKWICTNTLKQKVDNKAEWMTNGDLVVSMYLKYQDEDKECQSLLKFIRKDNKRADYSRGAAENAFQRCNANEFREYFKSPPEIPQNHLEFDKIGCSHMSIFVAGRYCKYSRDVSQSPWMSEDGKRIRGEGSVQEFISAQVTPMFNCEQVKFSGSGREDTDVRMLGKGRPFILEIINAKKTIFTQESLSRLQKQINESTNLISVRDLQIIDKKDTSHLKEGEEEKTKMYRALCHSPGHPVTEKTLEILNSVELPMVLQQITPIRVLHRRSLITRPRSILSMSAVKAKRSDEMFILEVQTEAGTYVKEFVHGDFGRTIPSVTSLLGYTTEILSLDVTGVNLNWPPEIKTEDDVKV